jgi:hypothetical protein
MVIDAVVVITEGPVEFAVGFGRVVDMALLGGAFGGVVVVDIIVFMVTVNPVEFCVCLFFLPSLLRVDVGARHKEVRLLKVPRRFFE